MESSAWRKESRAVTYALNGRRRLADRGAHPSSAAWSTHPEQLAIVDDADPSEAGRDRWPAWPRRRSRRERRPGPPPPRCRRPRSERAASGRARRRRTRARSRSPARAGVSSGGANCSSTPPMLRIAMRSLSLIASSMSWVTNTIVFRRRSWISRNWSCSRAAHDRVDGGERLVHQHHGRVGGQRAGHADPLALAAGELGRVSVEQLAVEVEDPSELVDAGAGAASSHPTRWAPWRCSAGSCGAAAGRVLDDVADAPAKLHRVLLEHVRAVEHDPPSGRLDQPVDHLERRGLAAARRPDERDGLALGDLEGEVADGRDGHSGVPLLDVLERDHRFDRP